MPRMLSTPVLAATALLIAACDELTTDPVSTPLVRTRVGHPYGWTGTGGPVPPGGRPAQRAVLPPVSDWTSLRIVLERSSCMGNCADYRVELQGDGTVTYEGRYDVEVTGMRRYQVPSEEVRELFRKFERAQFAWSHASYVSPLYDFPTYDVSISYDGYAKFLTDYAGLSIGMPDELRDLQAAIDETAGTFQWVGIACELPLRW